MRFGLTPSLKLPSDNFAYTENVRHKFDKMTELKRPKIFISYSHTNQHHINWVEKLAIDLSELGIYVFLDLWDLQEGADIVHFMERMIVDDYTDKVLVICDRKYVEKANERVGGVGKESQIISYELFKKVESKTTDHRIAALVTEYDSEGNPFLPIYIRDRKYIDMSDPSLRSRNFERLVKWIYSVPGKTRPEIGRAPSYVESHNVKKYENKNYRLRDEIDTGTHLDWEYGISNSDYIYAIKEAKSTEEFLDLVFKDITFNLYDGPIYELERVYNDINKIREQLGLVRLSYNQDNIAYSVRNKVSIKKSVPNNKYT